MFLYVPSRFESKDFKLPNIELMMNFKTCPCMEQCESGCPCDKYDCDKNLNDVDPVYGLENLGRMETTGK